MACQDRHVGSMRQIDEKTPGDRSGWKPPNLPLSWDEAEVSPPEWSRSRMDLCYRGSNWRNSGWRRPQRRRESCTFRALRSAPSGCSPGADSRKRGSRRRRRRWSGRCLSRQKPTWKSNRSKSYWGLPTRKTAWREAWTQMVIRCFSPPLFGCDNSQAAQSWIPNRTRITMSAFICRHQIS